MASRRAQLDEQWRTTLARAQIEDQEREEERRLENEEEILASRAEISSEEATLAILRAQHASTDRDARIVSATANIKVLRSKIRRDEKPSMFIDLRAIEAISGWLHDLKAHGSVKSFGADDIVTESVLSQVSSTTRDFPTPVNPRSFRQIVLPPRTFGSQAGVPEPLKSRSCFPPPPSPTR